ncbi:MAG TPA: hypothetical protein VHJ20_20800 [Polyangia bacterium]|nr:hypothetical protein [Polyangia bacterium]
MNAGRVIRAGALALGLAMVATGCDSKPGKAGYLPGFDAFVEDDSGCASSVVVDAGADADVDASGDAGDLSGWAGTWTFVSGSSGVACPDSISAAASAGVLVISASPGGGSLLVSEDTCTFQFSLAGATATSDCGQSCSAWAIPTIPEWTLTLQADGSLLEHLGGQIALNGEVCTISGKSKLTRSP